MKKADKYSVNWEECFESILNLLNSKESQEEKPKKRKDADKGNYIYCEYLDAGMEGMKCSKGYGDKNCECLHCFGYECSYYKPEKVEQTYECGITETLEWLMKSQSKAPFQKDSGCENADGDIFYTVSKKDVEEFAKTKGVEYKNQNNSKTRVK